MAYKKRVLENYNMLATGTGSFQKDDALIGRAVEMHAIDTVKLAANNAKIKGSIEGFDGGQVKIIVDSEDVPFRNSGATAIAVGSEILGATRVIVSGGSAILGYVKAHSAPSTVTQASVNHAAKARGIVIDGGGTHAADADAPADVKVSLSRG